VNLHDEFWNFDEVRSIVSMLAIILGYSLDEIFKFQTDL